MERVHTLPIAGLFGAPPARMEPAAIAAARCHKLDLLLLARLLRERPDTLTDSQRTEAVEALETAEADNRRLLDELIRVLRRLDAAGVPALPLKGPVLALLLHDDLSVRRSRDLDILVPEERMDDALGALRALGYSIAWTSGLAREIHLVHDARSFTVDLHWNIVKRTMPFALDFDEIWAERRFVRFGGATLAVPAPEWLVVITCIYLIKDHPKPRLVYLVDLEALLARFPDLAWDRVAAIAAGTGTRRICALGLALLGEFAGKVLPASARENFAADQAIRAAAARVQQALSVEQPEQTERPLHRLYFDKLRHIAAHASFRDRPTDKLCFYLHLVPLFLEWSASRWRQWVRRSPTIAVSVPCGDLRWLPVRLRAFLAAGHPRLAPGTSMHPLEDAGVVFAATTQRLYALSPSATFLWCCLEEGLSPRRTARLYADASGRSLKEARAEVATMLRTLRAMGLLGSPSGPDAVPPRANAETEARAGDADPPVLPAPTGLPVRRRYRLLGSVFDLGFADETLCRAVDPALRHLATTEAPDAVGAVIAEADGFTICIDGGDVERCETIEPLAPLVKTSLTIAATNRRDFALYLHAAMLRRSGAALLLPAAPGSGKTCLTAALARAGFAYHTDEITLLDRGTLQARGAPVALTVKDRGWPVLAPLYPEINSLATHRRSDGKIVRYLPPPVRRGDPLLDRAYPVRWVVFPRYTPEGPNRIEPISRLESIQLLLDECLALRLRFDSRVVQALVDWIAGIECHKLTFNDLHTSVRLVDGVCRTPPGSTPGSPALGVEHSVPV